MAQDPHKLDALEIIGDSGVGTRLIESDAVDGSLKFTDAKISSGILLDRIPGLQQVDNLLLVGKGGLGLSKDSSGVVFTSIQDAIDSVTIAKTKDDPVVIYVMPGLYTENLIIDKDGIEIRGLGRVVLRNNGVGDTVTVTANAGIPLGSRLRDLRIENTEDGRVCVMIDGGIGSTIGSESIDILDCDLVASGIGTFQIDADTVNNVRVIGGNWAGSSSTSLCRVQQCASFEMQGVQNANRITTAYDSTGDIPSTVGADYKLRSVTADDALTVDLDGAGTQTFVARDCTFGDVTVNGDRAETFQNCDIGDLTINDTAAVTFIDGRHQTVAGAAGASLAEKQIDGSVAFAVSTSESVAFAAPQPDTSYTVLVESEIVPSAIGEIPVPQNKTTTGFDIEFGAAQTTTVRYSVVRTL